MLHVLDKYLLQFVLSFLPSDNCCTLSSLEHLARTCTYYHTFIRTHHHITNHRIYNMQLPSRFVKVCSRCSKITTREYNLLQDCIIEWIDKNKRLNTTCWHYFHMTDEMSANALVFKIQNYLPLSSVKTGPRCCEQCGIGISFNI